MAFLNGIKTGCGILIGIIFGIFVILFIGTAIYVSENPQRFDKLPNIDITSNLKILDLDGKQTQYGSTEVTGRVKNNGTIPVKFIKIQCKWCNEMNEVIDSDTNYVCGDVALSPGESKGFKFYNDKKIPNYIVLIIPD